MIEKVQIPPLFGIWAKLSRRDRLSKEAMIPLGILLRELDRMPPYSDEATMWRIAISEVNSL